jgi:anti-sigma B factor antagonist
MGVQQVPSRSDAKFRVSLTPLPGFRQFPELEEAKCVVTGNLSFNISRSNGSPTVAVAGEIDLATAPELERVLKDFEHEVVTVDLSEVTFIDSCGLTVLFDAYTRIRHAGGQFAVHGTQPIVQRSIEITRLDDMVRDDHTAV